MVGVLKMVRGFKADAVERIEAELAELNRQGAELAIQIEQLAAREDDLDDAGELVTASAQTRAARNRLRKLDAEIAATRDRLAAAKAAARAKLRDELLADFLPAARDFLAKARPAQEALGRVLAAREALRASGFDADCQALPMPPHINGSALLAPDLVEAFQAALDPNYAYSRTHRAATPRRLATPARPAQARAPAIARALLRETARDGERLVEVLRAGVEHPRKGQLRVGDVIAMPSVDAEAFIRSGAGDFFTAADQTVDGVVLSAMTVAATDGPCAAQKEAGQ
jgi:hypothetical protein